MAGRQRMIMQPREGACWIAGQSRHVSIRREGVLETANLIEKMINNNDPTIRQKKWKDHVLNPKEADKDAIDWIFLVDTLNFSFWSEEQPKYTVTYAGQEWTGYWSLCAAINRAIDNGIPITDAEYLAKISHDDLSKILEGDLPSRQMPMIDERVQCCREVGKTLLKKFSGTFLTMVTACDRSAVRLVKAIADEFECYRDQVQYNGRTICIYKRAQILVADIWACFEGKGLGAFDDIDQLTIFADYRIPQVLVWLNTLEYSQQLFMTLRQDKMLQNGEDMEIEIRACAIHAIELIIKELKRRGGDSLKVNAVQIDHFLWDFRRLHSDKTVHIPYHKVRCIYY